MPKKDWIEEMNEYADSRTPKCTDRDLVEVMIMYLDQKKLGNDFVKYLRTKL